MEKRYLLIHTYEFCDGMETKELGIYSTTEKAMEAIARYGKLEGFCSYHEECFSILEFPLDVDHCWNEGFANSADVAEDFRNLTAVINEMAGMETSPEEAWKNSDYYYVLCEISNARYSADKADLAKYIQELFQDHMKKNLPPEVCLNIAKNLREHSPLNPKPASDPL